MSSGRPPAIDPGGVIAALRELADATSDEAGAQRLCWSPTWRRARELLGNRLAAIGIEPEIDEAGNLWARLPGAEPGRPALALGSHLDSVPGGGWLDGALGVLAALGVLEAWAASGERPPRDVVLIDFADEEGARFGRSLFGSSALAGTLDPAELRSLRDAAGEPIADVLAANGVELDRAPEAHRRLSAIGTYLELHIEQGPVLEAEGAGCAAVSGCAGVERHLLTFSGQASHAGTTPMDVRRDAGLAAAQAALEIERVALRHGGVGTTGRLVLAPDVVTAVAGRSELSVDLRHPDAEELADMLSEALAGAAAIADERRCVFGGQPIWRIAPIPFDRELVELATGACAARGGRSTAIPSGALHDAAEMARLVPTAMIFCASRGGISHAPEEDSAAADLTAAIEAFGDLAAAAI